MILFGNKAKLHLDRWDGGGRMNLIIVGVDSRKQFVKRCFIRFDKLKITMSSQAS